MGSLAPSSRTMSLVDLGNDISAEITDGTNGLKPRSNNGDDSGVDLTHNQPLKQSTFFFTSPSGVSEHDQNVPEEFRLLARPVSAKSDRSSLASDECGDVLANALDQLQPGGAIINFDENFDLDNIQPGCSASPLSVHQEADEEQYELESNPMPHLELPSHNSPSSSNRPSPIRQSILCLRRMNSDARHDSTKPGLFATKRYLMMDGVADLASPEMGRCDSWVSLDSVNSRAQSSNKLYSQGVGDDLPAAWLSPIDQALAVIPAGHSALNVGANRGAGSVYTTQRGGPKLLPRGANAVDVWEDREAVWDSVKRSVRGSPDILARPGDSNPTPFRMKVVPPSSEQTPMSLYDENGFLRRNSDEM